MADPAGDVLRDEKLMRAITGALRAPTGPMLGAQSLCKTMDQILHPKILQLLWGLRVLGSHVPKAPILARRDSLTRHLSLGGS